MRQDLQAKNFLGQVGATQAPTAFVATRQQAPSQVLSQSVALGINQVRQSMAGAVRQAINTGNGQIFPVPGTSDPAELQRIQNTNRIGPGI